MTSHINSLTSGISAYLERNERWIAPWLLGVLFLLSPQWMALLLGVSADPVTPLSRFAVALTPWMAAFAFLVAGLGCIRTDTASANFVLHLSYLVAMAIALVTIFH